IKILSGKTAGELRPARTSPIYVCAAHRYPRTQGHSVLDAQSPLPTTTSRPIALGIERIGLVSLLYTKTVGIILLLLVAAAVIGVERIKIDDSLSQLFRSETPEFRQYEE